MRNIYILLFGVLLFATSVSSRTTPTYQGTYADAALFVKSQESLRLTDYPDATRLSSGWGTAGTPGELIDLDEANRRFYFHFVCDYDWVVTHYPHLDRWTALVVTAARYNIGTFGRRMKKALRTGDPAKIAKVLPRYNRSEGKVNDVLTARRTLEVRLLLEGPQVGRELRTREVVLQHIQNALK